MGAAAEKLRGLKFELARADEGELASQGDTHDVGNGEVVGGSDALDLLLLAMFQADNDWLAEFLFSFGKHGGEVRGGGNVFSENTLGK